MAHSKSEGGKAPFYDDAIHDSLENEAEDRAKVLAVLHELIGDPGKFFRVDLIAVRAGLTREKVLAVTGTLHNFRQGLTFDNQDVVRYDPEPEVRRLWHQSGRVLQNGPIRMQPQDDRDERWGDDVILPDLPEPTVSRMFTIDSS